MDYVIELIKYVPTEPRKFGRVISTNKQALRIWGMLVKTIGVVDSVDYPNLVETERTGYCLNVRNI